MVLHARLPESLAGVPAHHGELQRVLAQPLHSETSKPTTEGPKGHTGLLLALASGDTELGRGGGGGHMSCTRLCWVLGEWRITHEQQKLILFKTSDFCVGDAVSTCT